MASHVNPVYEYRRPADLDAPAVRHPVIVIGAGPVGLVAAIDLAQRGVPVVVLDEDCTVNVGSRAICYAKRTLEILDRLGCGERVAQKGVQWHVGRVYFRDAQAYQFDLLPEAGHRRPAFVNLQQYHFEEALVDRARETGVDLRWCHEVVGVLPRDDAVDVEIRTPDGTYRLEAQWLIAADGARSTVRRLMGLDTEGKVFRDRFLIADIRMRSDFPAERRFWFAFGGSAMLGHCAICAARYLAGNGVSIHPHAKGSGTHPTVPLGRRGRSAGRTAAAGLARPHMIGRRRVSVRSASHGRACR